MTIEVYKLPAYWACYLINGDSSGVEQSEIEQYNNDTKDLGSCVGVSDEPEFLRYRGIGCDVLEYTFIKD